jgi:hypothetical protein
VILRSQEEIIIYRVDKDRMLLKYTRSGMERSCKSSYNRFCSDQLRGAIKANQLAQERCPSEPCVSKTKETAKYEVLTGSQNPNSS